MGRVFVAGSINMDVVATAERHPRIGETVAGQAVFHFPGGKGANQAVAAAKLGAPTTLIGCIGKDAFGEQLKAFLAAQGIDLSLVRETFEDQTGTAIITVADADNTIVVVPGANAMVDAADVAAPQLAYDDVAVSQFEIPQPAITAFFKRARAVGAWTILNPAPVLEFDAELMDVTTILVLNEHELSRLSGFEFGDSYDHAYLVGAVRSLPDSTNKIICVTLGSRGAVALIFNKIVIIPGHAVGAVDTTGAGDCFVGAFAAQLAGGKPISEALVYANAAASICVQRMGAAPSMPTAAEVEAVLSTVVPASAETTH